MPKTNTRQPYPKIQAGWKNASMLKKEIGGDTEYHDLHIRALREALTSDVAMQITCGDEPLAEALVETHLVGMRGTTRRPAVALSPEAQRLLPIYPALESDWKTGSMMRTKTGGDCTVHNRRISELNQALICDIATQITDGDVDAAEKLVDAHLAGMRNTTRRPALAASPDAQRLLEEKWGRVVRRSKAAADDSPAK